MNTIDIIGLPQPEGTLPYHGQHADVFRRGDAARLSVLGHSLGAGAALLVASRRDLAAVVNLRLRRPGEQHAALSG